jgi:hypothetical protein
MFSDLPLNKLHLSSSSWFIAGWSTRLPWLKTSLQADWFKIASLWASDWIALLGLMLLLAICCNLLPPPHSLACSVVTYVWLSFSLRTLFLYNCSANTSSCLLSLFTVLSIAFPFLSLLVRVSFILFCQIFLWFITSSAIHLDITCKHGCFLLQTNSDLHCLGLKVYSKHLSVSHLEELMM